MRCPTGIATPPVWETARSSSDGDADEGDGKGDKILAMLPGDIAAVVQALLAGQPGGR